MYIYLLGIGGEIEVEWVADPGCLHGMFLLASVLFILLINYHSFKCNIVLMVLTEGICYLIPKMSSRPTA